MNCLRGVAACAIAAGLLCAPAAHAATRSPEIIAAENCDPIVIPQPAKKKPVKKAVAVKKAAAKPALSKPAKPLPKPAVVKTADTAVAQAKPKPRPRPKPKPKVTTVAAKPMVIPDACPGAGSNPEDVAGLPTNLKDLMTETTPEALASIFPAAGGQSPLTTSLTDLAPSTGRTAGPANYGPTVPLMPGGGSVGSGGGGGSDETTPTDPPGDDGTPPTNGNPPTGGNPPVQVPEPGTLGIALGGLAGLVAFARRRRRA